MHSSAQKTTEPAIDWDAYVPTDETGQFAAAARDHFAALSRTDDLRRVLDGGPPAELWGELADHGYPAIGLPEELDGLGGQLDLCAVLEEAGRALLPAPLLTTAAAAQTLLSAGILDAVPDEPWTLALPAGNGQLRAFDARTARIAVAVMTSSAGSCTVRMLRIDPTAMRPEHAVDPSRTSFLLTEDSLAQTSETTVGVDADSVLAAARVCVAADLVGTAAAALDASIAHARSREQFGRPIGSFQAVKHLLVNAYVEIERARSLLLGAAVEIDRERSADTARRLSLLAKAAATDAALRATALRTQMLGAMGLTFESDSTLAVRRVRHTAPFLGSASHLYARAAATAASKEPQT